MREIFDGIKKNPHPEPRASARESKDALIPSSRDAL
jgi:hypothetical protein